MLLSSIQFILIGLTLVEQRKMQAGGKAEEWENNGGNGAEKEERGGFLPLPWIQTPFSHPSDGAGEVFSFSSRQEGAWSAWQAINEKQQQSNAVNVKTQHKTN